MNRKLADVFQPIPLTRLIASNNCQSVIRFGQIGQEQILPWGQNDQRQILLVRLNIAVAPICFPFFRRNRCFDFRDQLREQIIQRFGAAVEPNHEQDRLSGKSLYRVVEKVRPHGSLNFRISQIESPSVNRSRTRQRKRSETEVRRSIFDATESLALNVDLRFPS